MGIAVIAAVLIIGGIVYAMGKRGRKPPEGQGK
jgi:hypothetical protein